MPHAHEQTEYEFQLIKGEQPNAMKCLTRREVLVEWLGVNSLAVEDLSYFDLQDDDRSVKGKVPSVQVQLTAPSARRG